RFVAEILRVALREFVLRISVRLRTILLNRIHGGERGHPPGALAVQARLECEHEPAKVGVARADRVHDGARAGRRYSGYLVFGHYYRAVLTLGNDDRLGVLHNIERSHAGLILDQLVLIIIGYDHFSAPHTGRYVFAAHAYNLPDGRIDVRHSHLL